jgi:hypothetical protein
VGAPRVQPQNIKLTILQKEIEELMNVKGIGEKSFLKLKPLITVGDSNPRRTSNRGRRPSWQHAGRHL